MKEKGQAIALTACMRLEVVFLAHTRTRTRVMGFGANNMNNPKKICGAKTRKGTPCRNTRLYKNGRCKNHGGLSTGPRTEAGKARALANLKNHNEREILTHLSPP
jgi:hypothetical protein